MDTPLLWHIPLSHFNEKVRWALDYKRIPHTRRSMLPGVHQMVLKRKAGTVLSAVVDWPVEGNIIPCPLDLDRCSQL